MLVSGKNSSYKSHGKYRSPEVQLLSKLQLHEENVQDKQNTSIFKVRFVRRLHQLIMLENSGRKDVVISKWFATTSCLTVQNHFSQTAISDLKQNQMCYSQDFYFLLKVFKLPPFQCSLAGIKGRICSNTVTSTCNYLFASTYQQNILGGERK